MILLDTHVVSEVMKAKPDAAVLTWLDAQSVDTLFISSITLAELKFGIGTLPDGRRKDGLNQALQGVLLLLEGRVLAFDTDAAQHYAELAVSARIAGKGSVGKGNPAPDGYIAAIASARGFTVATRDVAPFEAARLKVINPWQPI